MALDKTSDVTSLSEPPNDLVMVIEDSDEDYEILLRTVKKIPLKCKLMRYDTGDEALEYLFGDDDNAEPDLVELPKLILLDLTCLEPMVKLC